VTVGVTSEFEDLEQALIMANKVNLAGAPGGTKAEALRDLGRMRNMFDALEAHTTNSFEATKEHRAEGHTSVVNYQKHHNRIRGPEGARRLTLAHRLRHLPLADAAMTDGKLSAEHVEVLAQAQHDLGEDIFALLEEGLVDAAVTERFVEFVRVVDYWVMRAKPADAEDRLQRQVRDRGASSSSTLGGAGRVDADFDPLSFPVWQAELGRLCEHLRQVDRAKAQDRLGRAPLDHELGRSARQRRLDAMRLMAERSAAYDGDLGPSSFCLNMHGGTDLVAKILERIIEALEAASPDGSVDLDDLSYDAESLHEFDDGTVITLNTILLALLTGTVRGVLFDPDGEVLRHGPARRLFTPAQAQAIRAKFWRCAHPYGCDRTYPFLQSDHVHEHHDGGRTDVANGQCLCRAHNIWKTNNKDRPPPPTDSPPDRSQRRRPPDPGPFPL